MRPTGSSPRSSSRIRSPRSPGSRSPVPTARPPRPRCVDAPAQHGGHPGARGGQLSDRPPSRRPSKPREARCWSPRSRRSSWRCTDTFHPRVAVLLNITPDHLDWHGSLRRLRRRQGPGLREPRGRRHGGDRRRRRGIATVRASCWRPAASTWCGSACSSTMRQAAQRVRRRARAGDPRRPRPSGARR